MRPTTRSLNSRLLWLTLVTLLPLVVFATIATYVLVRQERASVEQGARDRVRALSSALDAELRSSLEPLLALAQSQALIEDDLPRFYALAQRVKAGRPDWLAVHLALPSGQQIVNTLQPLGFRPIAMTAEMASLDKVLATQAPAIGDLAIGPITGKLNFGVRIPVIRGNAVSYVLSAVVDPGAIKRLLDAQDFPTEQTATIFDHNGRIVARSRSPASTVGQPVSQSFQAVLAAHDNGAFETLTLEGDPVWTSFQRSKYSGWGIATGIPTASISAAAWWAVSTLLFGTAFALVTAFFIARFLGRRISGPIADLAQQAKDVMSGDRAAQTAAASGVTELDALSNTFTLVFRDVAERLGMKAALQQSESRLRVTLASIGDGVVATDVEGMVTYHNPVAAQLTGWTQDQALGQPLQAIFEIVHEFTGEPVDNPALRALAEQRVVELANHTVLVAKDGRRTPIEDTAAPIRDVQGAVKGAVLIFRDVTQRRAQTRALEERERQFRDLAESIPQLCWMAEPDGHIFWYNQRWFDYTGTTLEQMQGWGWQSVHDAALLPQVMERWQAAIAQGEPFEMVFPLKSAEGPFREFLTRIVPIKDDQQRVSRWFGTNTDISVLTKAQEDLRVRERELRTLADNTPDVLARFDRELRHVFVNASVVKITGRSVAEFKGRSNRELGMPVELCDLWDAAILAVFKGQRSAPIEFQFESPDGPRDFTTQFIGEEGPEGRVDYVLAVSHDRTAEKAAQRSLQEADQRKDEFLATLAHELRNPLAPIRTGLHVLQRTQDPILIRRTQGIMDRQLDHMVRLIDDLLDISRITSGKVILRKERVTLNHIVETALEASQTQIEAAGQAVHVDLPSEPLWLDADATRICQVLSNLLTNAVKYSPRGSRITVVGRREANEIVVSVADTGVGIPPNMLAHVFDMFTQVDRTLDRAQGGLGIGLALAKRLIGLHGGSIAAASEGEDRGSTFTFRLPAAHLDATDQDGQAATQGVHRSLRILVVDDNIDAGEAMASLLQLLDHDVLFAGSGPVAIDMVHKAPPDVVFLDIGMPGMDGYEVARRLRSTPASSAVTLVALTGWGSDDDRRKTREAGFDFHLTKPAKDDELEAILVRVAEAMSKRLSEHGR